MDPHTPKVCLPYLARAKELGSREPVIAYWCKFMAAKVALDQLDSLDDAGKNALGDIMNDLEENKAALSDNELVADDAAGSAYIYNFASKVFEGADATDRAGKATRLTAKEFLAAATFFETLAIFGPLETDVQEKITYAKWKATSIAKAFREGRVPTPGPANASPLPQGSPALSSSAREDSVGGVFAQDGSYANPNDSSEDVSRQLLGTGSNSSSRPHQGHTDNITDLSEDKDDDEALNFSLPPPPGGDPSSVSSRPALPSVPSSHTAPPPPITAYRPSAPPADESFSSTMGTSTQSNNAGSSGSNTLPSSGDDWHPLPSTIDPTAMAQAQKYAKFAISALNYEDVDTARRELQKALQLIGG